MFRFFRSIRQSLLAENKTFKYLKYAVGEVLLIMIGIFLAMQLNNWNEGMKNAVLRDEYINRLIGDIEVDIIVNESRIHNTILNIELTELLINSLGDPSLAKNSPVDFLVALAYIGKFHTPFQRPNSFDELKSTGNIRLLGKELKADLQEYYAFFGDGLRNSNTRWEYRSNKFEENSVGILNLEQQRWLQDNFRGFLTREQLETYSAEIEQVWVNDLLTRLKQDPDLVAWIPIMRRQLMSIQNLLQKALDDARELHEALKATQKQPH